METPIEDMAEQPSIVGYADSDNVVVNALSTALHSSKPAVVAKPVTPKENPVYYIVTVENLANNTTREIKKYRGFYEKGYVTVGELLESYPRTVIWVNGEVMPMSYKIQQGDFVVRRHC